MCNYRDARYRLSRSIQVAPPSWPACSREIRGHTHVTLTRNLLPTHKQPQKGFNHVIIAKTSLELHAQFVELLKTLYVNVHVVFQDSRCIHFKLIYRPIRAVLTKMLHCDWSNPRDAFTITMYFLDNNETAFIVLFHRFSSKTLGLAKNL